MPPDGTLKIFRAQYPVFLLLFPHQKQPAPQYQKKQVLYTDFVGTDSIIEKIITERMKWIKDYYDKYLKKDV